MAWLRDHAKPSCLLARWLIKVREYDFVIKFIDGVRNTVAVAPSRYFLGDSPDGSGKDDPGIVVNNVGAVKKGQRPLRKPTPKLHNEQARDAEIVQLFKWVAKIEDTEVEPPDNASRDLRHYHAHVTKFKLIKNSLYRERTEDGMGTVFQYVVPTDRREALINSFHDSPIAGHSNNETVAKFIQHRFFWQGARYQIKKQFKEGHRCARAKTTPSNRPEMIPITATQPFEITFDIMGQLQSLAKDGSLRILVVMCQFTKMDVTRALKDALSKTVALVIFFEIICKHGLPKRILSDQVRNLNPNVMRALSAFDMDKRNTKP